MDLWLSRGLLCDRFSTFYGILLDKNVSIVLMHRLGWEGGFISMRGKVSGGMCLFLNVILHNDIADTWLCEFLVKVMLTL